jgi:arylformamidase
MLYDITPPITPLLKVWPGDTPPSREVVFDLKRGDDITLSTLRSTVHLGAHADGPSHYEMNAPGIESRSLEDFLGPCQVIRVSVDKRSRVGPEHLPARIDAPRVLFRTDSYPDPNTFDDKFAALSPELIDRLKTLGVRLVGIDTPSVDPFDSHDLPTHRACHRNDMSILEGLRLDEVPDGVYELVALPLRLVGFDASPVRAVLRTLP